MSYLRQAIKRMTDVIDLCLYVFILRFIYLNHQIIVSNEQDL
jgi:hypothetical protein